MPGQPVPREFSSPGETAPRETAFVDDRRDAGGEPAPPSEISGRQRQQGSDMATPGMFREALASVLGEGESASRPPDHHRRARSARPTTLAQVRADLGDCQRCKLSRSRKNIVFGVGDPNAVLFFVGEAPGAREDEMGEPFVGPAGQLLDRMIAAMGWSRDTVYIANVLKCRPPGNRDPQPDEIAACRPFLARQIDAVKPRIIVTLGRPAAHLVLDTSAPIHALRGRFQSYEGIRVMPTFHPAYMLRHPEHKRETWHDLKQVIGELDRLGIRSPQPPKR